MRMSETRRTMPYLKKSDVPFARVRRLLLGYGVNATALAEILDCSYNTAASRLRNPQDLTLRELGAISRRGHISIEEIREVISI